MVWPNYISEGKIHNVTQDAGSLALLRMLAARLERLSADSLWARRASGARGALLKALEAQEAGDEIPPEQFETLIETSFHLLERAAHEIPDPGSSHAAPAQPQDSNSHP
jgi:hypothetical protein